jgi:hypothetical protein
MTLAFQVLGHTICGAGVPMLAGALHATVCQTTCLASSSRAGRIPNPRNSFMDNPELVEVPCPECRCSPVEVLKRMHTGRRFLWCPQCRAIWAASFPASPSDPAPWVIAFGPPSMRRPLP